MIYRSEQLRSCGIVSDVFRRLDILTGLPNSILYVGGIFFKKDLTLMPSKHSIIRFCTPSHISPLIISMTKLLDADWLRGVQLFH